jgi:hypothetical protein
MVEVLSGVPFLNLTVVERRAREGETVGDGGRQ